MMVVVSAHISNCRVLYVFRLGGYILPHSLVNELNELRRCGVKRGLMGLGQELLQALSGDDLSEQVPPRQLLHPHKFSPPIHPRTKGVVNAHSLCPQTFCPSRYHPPAHRLWLQRFFCACLHSHKQIRQNDTYSPTEHQTTQAYMQRHT